MYNLAKALSENHDVDIVAVAKDDEYQQPENEFSQHKVFEEHELKFYLRGLGSLLSSEPIQCHAYFSSEMKQWVDENIAAYDLVYCTHLATAKYAEDTDSKKVLDFVDAVSNNFSGFIDDSSFLWSLVYRIEARRAKGYEESVADTFDECFITTQSDRRKIDANNISVIPNGVSPALFEYERTLPPTNEITFLGDLSYLPNVTAVNWFVDEIFPHVREAVPDVSFKIIGKSPPQEIKELDEEADITVTGFVDDPYEHVRQGKVSVAPVRIGGGIQNKVLESLALETPVVTTKFGATGIQAERGEHFLVRNDPEAFASGVVEILRNDDLAAELGTNGQKLIQERYTWDSVGEKLNEEIAAVLNGSAAHETSDI